MASHLGRLGGFHFLIIFSTVLGGLLLPVQCLVLHAGVIILYRLYHNGILMYNSSSACNVSLTQLEVWSAHEFRLETCTAVGCASSRSVLSRTLEEPPEGPVGLAVNVSSARTVRVYWTPVSAANGLLRYHVYFTGPFYTQGGISQFHFRYHPHRRHHTSSLPPPGGTV